MAPIFRREVICPIAFNNASIDQSLAEINTPSNSIRSRDEHALLYIVVTLLFYSLGIIIGIVTYLKQEKEEIEENKMFDEFIAFNKGKSVLNNAKDRQVLVQKTINRLKELETASYLNRSHFSSFDHIGTNSNSYGTPRHNKLHQIRMEEDYNFAGDLGAEYDMSNPDDDPFPNRRLSQVVAKILESETNIDNMDEECVPDTETVRSHQHETQSDTIQRSDSGELGTDFIDYNEEPKNKALLRGLEKEHSEMSTKDDNVKQHLVDSSVYEAKAIDTVYESSKRRQSLLEKFAHNDLESIEEETESPTYKWSVTSV